MAFPLKASPDTFSTVGFNVFFPGWLACLFVKVVRSELFSLKYNDCDGFGSLALRFFWVGPVLVLVMALLPLPDFTVKEDGTVADKEQEGTQSHVCRGNIRIR